MIVVLWMWSWTAPLATILFESDLRKLVESEIFRLWYAGWNRSSPRTWSTTIDSWSWYSPIRQGKTRGSPPRENQRMETRKTRFPRSHQSRCKGPCLVLRPSPRQFPTPPLRWRPLLEHDHEQPHQHEARILLRDHRSNPIIADQELLSSEPSQSRRHWHVCEQPSCREPHSLARGPALFEFQPDISIISRAITDGASWWRRGAGPDEEGCCRSRREREVVGVLGPGGREVRLICIEEPWFFVCCDRVDIQWAVDILWRAGGEWSAEQEWALERGAATGLDLELLPAGKIAAWRAASCVCAEWFAAAELIFVWFRGALLILMLMLLEQ